MAAEDEDGHAVVMVTVPASGRFEGPAACDHRPGGEHVVENLAVGAFELFDIVDASKPFVKALSAVPQTVIRGLGLGPATNPSRDMDMYSTVEDTMISFVAMWRGLRWPLTCFVERA